MARSVLPEPREDPCHRMIVGIDIEIGHRIDGKRHVEPELMCMASGGLDADARRDARDDHVSRGVGDD